MFGLWAHCFFLQDFGSGLVFRLVVDIVVITIIELIFLVLFFLFQFVVKLCVLDEFVLIVFEQWMFQDRGKTHSFLAIEDEDFLEEVVKLTR